MNDVEPMLTWAGETVEGFVNTLVAWLNALFSFLGVGRLMLGYVIQVQPLDW